MSQVRILTAVSGRMKAAPSGGGTPTQGLAHSLDVTKKGLGMKPTCTEDNCDKAPRGRGLCGTHYQALRRAAKDGSCRVPECPSSKFTQGLCSKHYQRLIKFGSTELPPKPDPSPCSVANCERAATLTGYCSPHYQRASKHGDPEHGGRLRLTSRRGADADERFWSKVEKTAGCWLWLGAINTHGYGNFYLGEGIWVASHRYAYGPVPEGMELDHVCHTLDANCTAVRACPHRRCINPSHLEPVTAAENLRRARERNIK